MTIKIGSFAWAMQNQGQLSFKEKLTFMHRVMLPSTVGFLKTKLKLERSTTNVLLEQIKIPDTAMVKLAIDTLDAQSNPMLINHSWRSYLWGAGLACIHGKHYDAEILLTSALYHDIGLTDQYLHDTDCRCFTLKSASVFEQDANTINYPAEKLNLIKDAICMHMNAYAEQDNPSEITLLQYGVTCDVIGSQLYTLPEPYRNQVLQHYPRENFNQAFRQRLKIETAKNQHSRTAVLSSLGLPMMVRLNPYQE